MYAFGDNLGSSESSERMEEVSRDLMVGEKGLCDMYRYGDIFLPSVVVYYLEESYTNG